MLKPKGEVGNQLHKLNLKNSLKKQIGFLSVQIQTSYLHLHSLRPLPSKVNTFLFKKAKLFAPTAINIT